PTVLLERQVGVEAAGIYGATTRLMEAGMLVPSVLTAALVPRLAHAAGRGGRDATRRTVARALGAMATAGLGVGIVLWVGADIVAAVMSGGSDGFDALPSLLRAAAWLYPWLALTMVGALALIALHDVATVTWVLAVALGVLATALWV